MKIVMHKFILCLLLLTIACFARDAAELRAVKLTNVDSNVLFSDQNIARAMDYLASIGINTVITVVWNSHGADGDYTIYPSSLMDSIFGQPMIPTFDQNRDPLQRVVIEAHRNGIEVLTWFEMGFSSSYSQNGGHIISRFPEWALKDINGNLVVKNGFDWMSGINPEVQNLLRSLALETADQYDIDGVEFSDRIPALPVEGGYDSVTAGIYRAEHGGASPPINYANADWMRWRADKLSDFDRSVRDSLKARSEHLLFSSSPSAYPWSYAEYLQDSKTWVDSGIVDNIIPQLYRYSISEYIYELNQSLSYIPSGKRDIFFAGVLMNVGNYTISPEFLLQSLQANRQRNVMGEAFFFYEGLRKNNNLLGDTLKATYYALPALLPYRNGRIWRPRAVIINEDEPDARLVGNWTVSTIAGFRPNILLTQDTAYASITYWLQVPESGWYDVFPYVVTGPLAAHQAQYTFFSAQDSSAVIYDQTNLYHAGWQPLKTVYLEAGKQKVMKVDNALLQPGEILTADACMIMINRKLSPEVIFTSIHQNSGINENIIRGFDISANYPNPFNSRTVIPFTIPSSGQVSLEIYAVTGQKVDFELRRHYSAGEHTLTYDANDLASGVYFYRIRFFPAGKSASLSKSGKFVLVR